ncbi:hypothetical protein PanWU01x14_150290, partial [Parasponia andersonii]
PDLARPGPELWPCGLPGWAGPSKMLCGLARPGPLLLPTQPEFLFRPERAGVGRPYLQLY